MVKTVWVGPPFSVAISSAAMKMKFQDLRPEDLQMLSLDENKLTVVLAGDRIETFTFSDRQEVEEAIRLWVQSRMTGKTGPRSGSTAGGEGRRNWSELWEANQN